MTYLTDDQIRAAMHAAARRQPPLRLTQRGRNVILGSILLADLLLYAHLEWVFAR